MTDIYRGGSALGRGHGQRGGYSGRRGVEGRDVHGSDDAAGNLTNVIDSVMGTWSYGYDTLNRLTSGQNTATTSMSQQYAGQNLCWAYDAFGNRTAQSQQPAACSTSTMAQYASTLVYNASNQVSLVIPPGGGSISPSPYTYDPSGDGDVTMDVTSGNRYLYDGEGRVCAVSGPGGTWGYLYDAEGDRVAKGSITSWSCDPSANGIAIAANETDYVLGPGGEQVTELAQGANGGMNWQRTYVYAGGALIATYDPVSSSPNQPLPSFRFTDWLGTMRAATDSTGVAQGTCAGLPFGDGLACSGDIPDNHHFTGKERDTESGNDYFGARYYASSIGRWLSPDWSAKEEPVPYAKLDDPQTLNLYAYLGNNPLAGVDADGHATCAGDDGSNSGEAGQSGVCNVTSSRLQQKALQQNTPNLKQAFQETLQDVKEDLVNTLKHPEDNPASMVIGGVGEEAAVAKEGEQLLTRYGTKVESTLEKLAGDEDVSAVVES